MSSQSIKTFFKAYRWHEVVRSLLTALIFASVVILPLIVLLVNMLLLWFWRINLFGFLFGIAFATWGYLIIFWFYDTLVRYKAGSLKTLTPSPRLQGLIFAGFLFLITVIITVFIVPIYL